MPDFVKVASVADLPPGTVKSVTVRDKWIALANVGGTIYAIDNVCLHRGGPLGEGYLDGEKLECPWHGWQFDVTTGALVMNPREKLPTYEVRIEGSDVLVAV
jgi:3-phenylpropionate/trans-cinnamate dioxygenase ferredoxin component